MTGRTWSRMDNPEAGSSHDAEVPMVENPVLLIVSWHTIRMVIMKADKDTPDATMVAYQNALNKTEGHMHEYAVKMLDMAEALRKEGEGGKPDLKIVKS